MTPFPWPPPACIHVRGICSPRNKLSDAARAHTQNGVRSRTYAVCTAARSPYEVRKNLQDAIFGQEISKQCPVYKEVFACHKTAPISTSNFVDTDSGGVSPADKVGDSLSLYLFVCKKTKKQSKIKTKVRARVSCFLSSSSLSCFSSEACRGGVGIATSVARCFS